MGGLRAAAQLIAYELPLVLAVIGVAIQAGSLSLNDIVTAQASWQWFNVAPEWLNVISPFMILQVVGLTIFLIASLAELSRIPFDMPIAESELTMGYLTEYSGMRFTMFFLGEYAGLVSMAAIAATLFLGGYWVPGLDGDVLNFVGPVVLLSKVMLIAFLFIWLRWTFPRLREDQLQTLAWKWLIPAGLANILVTAFFRVVF
jgi:NADH-quinone oxidoreductase subunit H